MVRHRHVRGLHEGAHLYGEDIEAPMPVGSTRPDVQAKRDAAYSLNRREVAKMHARAADHERRAASLGHTIATMQAEQISAMVAAALLRERARIAT